MEKLEINPKVHTEINDKIIYAKKVIWNLEPADLIEEALQNREGVLARTGAFVTDTGKFTGRSPDDRFIVEDNLTRDTVFWGDINKPVSENVFKNLLNKVVEDLNNKTLYVRDAYVCASKEHRLNVRVINTKAWHNLFCSNMFLRPKKEELEDFTPNFTIICDPEFEAIPEIDGTRSTNFAILNMTERIILIGGTEYSGEMKKGVFSVLNYLLPLQKNVLSMHCSANVGKQGDTAIFFGLSGTGKTTLSADPTRALIGDDEHGWDDNSVFNFEGGCYAKVINLDKEKEPDIWNAIRFGGIVENTKFFKGTRKIDYTDKSITQNTRVSYPIEHIDNIQPNSIGKNPKNIFFLTADGLGVLPPISKLTSGQAMYHFISGYTSKVAGTEVGVNEPKLVFSACFGEPFMPLHPTKYAELLGEKMEKGDINVWLVNTGWIGGPYGIGHRMDLPYTRAMIHNALNGNLENVEFEKLPIFNLAIPKTCENVPSEILNPINTWDNSDLYFEKANHLANQFNQNFRKYAEFANDKILSGAPQVKEKA
jgi:phosphoenolpyruvate carboxykinase (ATP)